MEKVCLKYGAPLGSERRHRMTIQTIEEMTHEMPRTSKFLATLKKEDLSLLAKFFEALEADKLEARDGTLDQTRSDDQHRKEGVSMKGTVCDTIKAHTKEHGRPGKHLRMGEILELLELGNGDTARAIGYAFEYGFAVGSRHEQKKSRPHKRGSALPN